MAVYLKIATELRDEIRHQYQIGDFLPPEKQLAERFNVNRHTLRRAVDELVQDGLVRRFQGIGNQIAKPKIDYVLHDRASYSHNLASIGLSLETRVLNCRLEKLRPGLADRLKLPANTAYVLLTTCRLIDGRSACLIRHHLFDVELEKMQAFHSGSLHQFLLQQFNCPLKRGNTRLRARMPNFEECNQLQLGRGVPVLEVHTQNFHATTGALKEYSLSLSRSDMFEYSLEP
ncbi:phosphonate metabolism transcriptional regulator PhnF [Marinobacterium aestuarii]|uniref:Phosphonate metabolism transcriptional regulator PhnF n=1 Tax=Marinobacterium aestuarii TaxID=1821621 RepID=A0A1A9F0B4_9GAMM|nr:phosphonate metabolism transcriptional regulator PhnF [Marinobacterium aestuarii]ANG63784.1 phosphonate metabolism transcriptional regulator PhnF [Marinobacterium aestuarii]